MPSQLVVGVYVDTMTAIGFNPYVVSLYFRCTENVSVRTELVKNTQSKNQDCKCDDQVDPDEVDLEQDSEELNPDQVCSTI
jgi:hypothetical protein